MTFKTVIFILIAVCLFEVFPWPLDLIAAFIILTKHTQNFVLNPLAKYFGARGISPTNYMERKLKNIREVIWFFAVILDIELVFVLELFAIGISCKIINNLKNKMEIPTSVFSKDDYTIYDEYLKNNPPLVKDVFYGYNSQIEEIDTESIQEIKEEEKIEEKREENFEKEIEIPEVELPEVDMNLFDKPIEEIKTDFSIKTTPIENVNKFDFNKPVGEISTSTTDSSIITSKIEIKEDEITCEKCGTIMSKNKIACPKCGELVKYKPSR